MVEAITKKKILFITGSGYGIEGMVVGVVRWLFETGRWEVAVALVRPDDGGYANLPEGVRTIRIVRRNVSHSYFALADVIGSFRPDVIYSTMVQYNLAAIIARLISRHKCGLVVSEHGSVVRSLMVGNSLLRRLKLALAYIIALPLYRAADRVHFLTNRGARTDARFLFVSKRQVAVVPNFIDGDRVRRLANESSGHDWLDHKSVPVIVSVGKLAAQKDQTTMLRAFAQVLARQDARLIIVGEGPDRVKLEKLARDLDIADKVALVGHRDNPYSFMKWADIFLMTSVLEGFPLAPIEAMALGRPVVLTDCDTGPAEIVQDGISGLLVPVGDVEGVTQAILRVLRDNALAKNLGDAALVRSMDFSPEKVGIQFENLFRL